MADVEKFLEGVSSCDAACIPPVRKHRVTLNGFYSWSQVDLSERDSSKMTITDVISDKFSAAEPSSCRSEVVIDGWEQPQMASMNTIVITWHCQRRAPGAMVALGILKES